MTASPSHPPRHAKIANSPMGRVDHAIPVGVEIGHVRVRQHHLHDHVKVNAQTPRQGPTRFGHRAPSSHREHIDHQKKHHNVRDVIDAILHLKTRQEKCITSALQDPIARLRSRHSCCLPESSHVFEVPVFWVCPQMLDDEERSLNVKLPSDGANHDVQITDLRRVPGLCAPIQSFAGVADCAPCLHEPNRKLQHLMIRVNVGFEVRIALRLLPLMQASGEGRQCSSVHASVAH